MLNEILRATLRRKGIMPDEWERDRLSRKKAIVEVIQITTYIAAVEYMFNDNQIARFFKRTRTTIFQHRQNAEFYYNHSRYFQRMVEEIKAIIGKRLYEIEGFISRNSNGILAFSPEQPEYCNGMWLAYGSKIMPKEAFPQITHNDKPQKVTITIKLHQ